MISTNIDFFVIDNFEVPMPKKKWLKNKLYKLLLWLSDLLNNLKIKHSNKLIKSLVILILNIFVAEWFLHVISTAQLKTATKRHRFRVNNRNKTKHNEKTTLSRYWLEEKIQRRCSKLMVTSLWSCNQRHFSHV